MAALRIRQAQLREQLGAWHQESSELHRQMEDVQRDLAVWQERGRLSRGSRARSHGAESEPTRSSFGPPPSGSRQPKKRWPMPSRLDEKEGLVAEAQADLDAHEDQREALAQQVSRSAGAGIGPGRAGQRAPEPPGATCGSTGSPGCRNALNTSLQLWQPWRFAQGAAGTIEPAEGEQARIQSER